MSERDLPIPAAPHHKRVEMKINIPKMDETPVRCRHCPRGFRHPVGNCVVCGCGPAPGAVNWFGEPMPETELEKQIVVWKLFNNVHPPTLDGQNYPTPNQLAEFKLPDRLETAFERMLREAKERAEKDAKARSLS